MSFKISLPTNGRNIKNDENHNHNGNSAPNIADEWVEIVEPKSKTKIYANLNSGVCSKHPPEGVTVLKADDFADRWWELYDKKTGKYYYYNPEQQKTAWTKPTADVNGDPRQLLIIPVSRLQTFRRVSPTDSCNKEKCDASTQTIVSSLVSTGTQTVSKSTFETELSDRLSTFNINGNLSKSKTHSNNETKSPQKSYLNHRRLSDFGSRYHSSYVKIAGSAQTNSTDHNNKNRPCDQPDRSSQTSRPLKNRLDQLTHLDDDDNQEDLKSYSYFGPSLSYQSNQRRSMHIPDKSSTNYNGILHRNDEQKKLSTFKSSPKTTPEQDYDRNDKQNLRQQPQQPQQMTTNNLSHYLVREAQAMGIALISDDDIDDDDQDSEDDYLIDEDEDTDLRDDLSSLKEGPNDFNASQDFCEDSSEGWKSLSDHESPLHLVGSGVSRHNIGGAKNKLANQQQQHLTTQKSPVLSDTNSSNFAYNDLIDDQKDPAACRSQQLDHRKLVENFKKSRQTSALGYNDSLGRSYRMDANQAVQKIKNVADSYFTNDRERLTDKHLRNLSTLSTLPRQHKESKDRNSTKKPPTLCPSEIDADYDVVEENCSYHSDSDHVRSNLAFGKKSFFSPQQTKAALDDEDSLPMGSHFDRNKSTRGSTFSVESFARENLSRHPKKGGLLFNRKVKWSRMISWTKNSIKQPMISSVISDLNSDSIAAFKLIQQYMGDRKITITKKYRHVLSQAGISEDSFTHRRGLGRSSSTNVSSGTASANNSTSSAGQGPSVPMIPEVLRDEIAHELAVKGCSKTALRDEIFVQLARQLTENPNQDSINWGLILMSILLNYFSPSAKFAPFLLSFLETHPHAMAQDVCLPRLDKRLRQNWLSYCRKPADGKEISIVRLSITKWPQYCGVFGESLERIMSLQTCSPYLKTLRLPWILTTLGEKLIETGGMETEGIFRVAADQDLLAQLRLEIDCVDFRKITDAKQVKSLLSNVQDPHVIAGLLKLFFRQMYEPVFPVRIYDACLQHCQDGQMACRLFSDHLPNLNKDVVAYLVRVLQLLSESDKVTQTKMDNSNLSMVWAPNLLRVPDKESLFNSSGSNCDSLKNGSKWSIINDDGLQQTPIAQSQSMIFEQTRQEMQFIRSLIIHLDTSFIKDVI